MPVVEVKLWGLTIGYLGYEPGQSEVATFEYSEALLNTPIEISPIKIRNRQRIHSFPDDSYRTFRGLPGIFADSLPDNFGNKLIDIYMAERNIPASGITALDRLLYVGTRGMGALEYHPAETLDQSDQNHHALDLHMLAELAALVTSKANSYQKKFLETSTRAQALKLVRMGSSAGGARSKALVAQSPGGQLLDGTIDHGTDHSYWLLKFDTDSNRDREGVDPKGMTRVEYIYSILAKHCEIDIPQTSYIEDGDDFHYLIERFDRVNNDGALSRLHYASWCGLAHAHRDATGAYSYELLILLSRQLKLGQKVVTELFKRAVFNIVGRNQDDHTKNFGFLMDQYGEWRLAPAFDMTYSYDPRSKWTRVHQVSLSGKQDVFTRKDLIRFGQYCNLTVKKAILIIDRTVEVFRQFDDLAKEFKVEDALRKTISHNLRFI